MTECAKKSAYWSEWIKLGKALKQLNHLNVEVKEGYLFPQMPQHPLVAVR